MPTSCRSALAALLLSSIALHTAGCAVKRISGPGPSIGTYDYAVISQQGSREYYQRAQTTLDQVFVVVDETDPRLELPSVRQKACTVTVDWSPGFWSTSGWVELKDYAHGTHVHTSHMRRGMVWVGADADVLEAMRDVAMARAAGPAIPPAARQVAAPAPYEDARNPSRSTAQRLEELNNLRARGLISEAEYSAQRKTIIQEH
jgi:hypothetical protein